VRHLAPPNARVDACVVAIITESKPTDGLPAGVLVVDDDPWFLALLRDVVHATSRLATVGLAESGERAVELAHELRPDIVIVDVWMPGLGGIEAARLIKTSLPSTLVVLVSTTRPDELPPEAETVGADAIVWKSDLEPGLLDEIWSRSRREPRP